MKMLRLARLVAARDDRRELVAALYVCYLPAVVLVTDHVVVPYGIGRPQVHNRAWDRRALLVQNPSREHQLGLVARLEEVGALGSAEPEVRTLDLTGRLLQLARSRRIRLPDCYARSV